MSAPKTNIEKQKKNHIWPIIGIVAVVLLVLAGFLIWFADETDDPVMPGGDTNTPIQPAEPQAN